MKNNRAEILIPYFKDNDKALKTVRKYLFGAGLTTEEIGTLVSIFSGKPEVKTAFITYIFQEATLDAEIGQNLDFWSGADKQIVGMHVDTIRQILTAKEKCLKMLRDATNSLDTPEAYQPESILEYSFTDDEQGIRLYTRNLYIESIEKGLNFIKFSCLNEEDQKKIVENIRKNSTR